MPLSVHLMPKVVFSVLLVVIIGLMYLNCSNALPAANSVLPCDFQDSINITDGTREADGSIKFNNVLFARDQYAEINYFHISETVRVFSPKYLRGCPCNVDTCIRLCCSLGKIWDRNSSRKMGELFPCRSDEMARRLVTEIIDENRDVKTVELNELFSYVIPVMPRNYYVMKTYQITQAGAILAENQLYNHRNYCLLAKADPSTNNIELTALVINKKDESIEVTVRAIGTTLLVLFISVTITIYICIPELRNLHGMCLLAYLIGLLIGFAFSTFDIFNDWHYIDPALCKLTGYLIYFPLVSAFLWSNVISYDLWQNIGREISHRTNFDKKRFCFYMLYAWGISLLLTFIIFILDYTKPLSNRFLPGLGTFTCFFKDELSTRLYFYVPNSVIYTINIVLFILTVRKIRRIQVNIISIMSEDRCAHFYRNCLINRNNKLRMFVRLFIAMGLSWIVFDILSLAAMEFGDRYLRDSCYILRGVFIFMQFVMNRRVLNLIKIRYKELHDRFKQKQNGK